MTDPDFRGLPAGIVTRSLACALDACVVVATMLVLWGGWSVVSFLSTPVRFNLPRPTWTHVVLTAAVTAVLYLATSWALSGRTYGDQVLGIRVLRHGLRPLGWWRPTPSAIARTKKSPCASPYARVNRGPPPNP